MFNLNKVVSSLQKIKSKNLGQNQKNVVNDLVKYFSFTNNEVEILIDHAVPMNVNRWVLFNGETSHRIVKSYSPGKTKVLLVDTQLNTEEDAITRNTVILIEIADTVSTREAGIITTADMHETDYLSKVIKSISNYLNETIEKCLHSLEDQINGL